MVIDRFNIADMGECVSLFKQAFSVEPWNEYWSDSQAKMRLECIYNTPYFFGLTVWEEAEILGFCMGNAEPYLAKKVFSLREICIKPNRQCNGIGSSLLVELINRLNIEGITDINLTTKPGSRLERFYLNNGFVKDELEALYTNASAIT